MAKKNSPLSNTSTKPQISPGVELVRVIFGHPSAVLSLAMDPVGSRIASGHQDGVVNIWDIRRGALVHSLNTLGSHVTGIAFGPQGKTLATGGQETRWKLWDVKSGEQLFEFEGGGRGVEGMTFDATGSMVAGLNHLSVDVCDMRNGKLLYTADQIHGLVGGVAFSPEGKLFACGSVHGNIQTYNANSGQLLSQFSAHKSIIYTVAFSPSGKVFASGSDDGTIKLWGPESGTLLRTLEGHTSVVDIIAFSPDGRLLATKSNDDTIRLWNCLTWETIACIPVPKMLDTWVPSLVFHPTLPLLVTVVSAPKASAEERCREIHFYELDYDRLLAANSRDRFATKSSENGGARNDQSVHSTTAKIVLVGDSGVGKTGLGWRLAHGDYREHDSTHGQQFWVLDQLATTRADGTLCEAVLWDLAGQPDYRLIHALSIQDADLALILFDPTNSRDPLGSAEYWLRQLPADCPKILVAARVDRGHPVLTDDELAAFCRRKGIAGGWIATSARENLGLDELIDRMKRAIPWHEKPVVTTDAVFKRIKDFVLTLKESRTRKQIIFTAAELHAAIAKQLKRRIWKETIATVITPVSEVSILQAVRNLSSQGFVRLLRLASGEERILLVPELMNNLAASIVLEARRNPRGLGAVEESRLFDNSYQFRELEKLSKVDKELLIDGTVEAFLSNRLSYRCFREHAGEIKLLIFPDLMNLKKPQRDDLITEDGASYILTGSTENTFAGLVVLLGYTNLFVRTDQAHDTAWFESPNKEICGVRQIREENERTIVLLFSRDASPNIRQVFEGLVEQMLSCRDTHVRRVRPVKCSKCGTPVDRAVMARLLKQGKTAVGCENADCLHRINLPPDEPLSVKPDQRRMIVQEGAVAELRTRFEEVIFELSRLAQTENRKAPTCFISYAWGNPLHERWVEHRLAMDLEKAGIHVILDRWENSQIGSSIPRFVDLISKADRVLIVGTNAYRQK